MSGSHILYDDIGKGYNSTRRADPYLVERLYALLSPQANGLYLDIGCGTGNYTTALAGKRLNFYGLEPSEEMLGIARLNESNVHWIIGAAESISVSNTIFDGAIATLTIHHWTDLAGAFNEINRVLKPLARLVIFTATPDQMHGYWLNHYFPRMLGRSIMQMPSFEVVASTLTKAGFEISITEKYFIAPDLQDHFLYSGKHDPELYFDPDVRKGISSFSALANLKEVAQGLAELRKDIDSGEFLKVKARYANEGGDYLFIAANKTT
ncbi:MAG TPA: class I SAM-dependent methyltransferase [Mucilaginibacter sp.]